MLSGMISSVSGIVNTSGDNVAIDTDAQFGASDTKNIAIGGDTLDASLSGAQENIAIGYNAGSNITSGDYNVLIGAYTGDGFSTSHYNVAVGRAALSSGLTTASNGTVAVGYASAFSLTTGAANIGIGYEALKYHTTGSNNLAIGYGAMDGTQGADPSGSPQSTSAGSSENIFIGKSSGGGSWADSASAQNVCIGNYTMDDSLDGASNNVAIGYHALGVITSGDGNTAVGYQSMDACDNGLYNTALGYRALSGNPDDENVAIGSQAGKDLAGTTNVTIGALSMYTAAAVDKCVAMGYKALYTANAGDADGAVAIGYEAGYSHAPSGGSDLDSSSVFIGYQAGKAVSGSKYNTAIGFQALSTTTAAGNSNTCMGYLAGTAINGGANNTIVGASAGEAIAGGAHNTVVGFDAGDAITSGDHNVSIGHTSDCAATVDRQIAIGYAAVATAVDSIVIGTSCSGGVTRTVTFGDAGNQMISSDWDTGGTASWSQASDRRKKRNIEDSALGLEFINKLKPRTFQFKPQNELPKEWKSYNETNRYDTEKVHVGFIAQEVKEVLDEYDAPNELAGWMQDPDGMQRLGETKLITPLIKAVQELSQQIQDLKKG